MRAIGERIQDESLIGGAAAWPVAANGQAPQVPVIGYLVTFARNDLTLVPFHRGLSEAGFVEGRNVSIEYRFAENNFGQHNDGRHHYSGGRQRLHFSIHHIALGPDAGDFLQGGIPSAENALGRS